VTLVSLTLGYEHLILHPALFIIHRKFYIFQPEGTRKLLTGTRQLVQYNNLFSCVYYYHYYYYHHRHLLSAGYLYLYS